MGAKSAPEFATLPMWIAEVLRFVCAIFLFAGWMKGVAGLGLSAVARSRCSRPRWA